MVLPAKPTRGYAATSATSPLAPYSFTRRSPGPADVVVAIDYCGVCHTDVGNVRNELDGKTAYPVVPGHEIIGRVAWAGEQAAKDAGFHVDDVVGVGYMVDACRACAHCHQGLEQFCLEGYVGTCNGRDRVTGEPSRGGYSQTIVVNMHFVFRIPPRLAAEPARTAPLLCAGVTVYSALRHWKVAAGQQVGVVGLGGLGHMAIKIATAMGAEVTVFTTSAAKRAAALELGAARAVLSTDADAMRREAGRFDVIVDTVAHSHDLPLPQLKLDGTLVLVGVPEKPLALPAHELFVAGRKQVGGSFIGSVAETREMLEFCAEHGVLADVEVIPIQAINEAYERMLRSDVRYRFVIDMRSL